jgi:hypothetical protein
MHSETETASAAPSDVPDDGYAALARLVPLRPINSTEEHDRAIALLNSLIDRHSELTPGEIDYMDVLGLIVAHYEDGLYGELADDPGDDEAGGE